MDIVKNVIMVVLHVLVHNHLVVLHVCCLMVYNISKLYYQIHVMNNVLMVNIKIIMIINVNHVIIHVSYVI